ncbi:proline-specific permease ProY [Candidatus Williamhamiltonella defendens]|uniref:proline-specific permease ProY n=1 Tax=Candidatus Williamhamiltonella defendens TaxID=138072 RepID=UPI00130EF5B5|nr:proline-specific permease ProY [Candidatus Hamiltonella defensa]
MAKNTLKRRLNARHIRFMALGSAIGTGLFYGSADAIKMAGPSVLVAYMMGGLAAFIIMRALGEMAVNNPKSSSFSLYAEKYLGPMAGYVIGWTYCFEILIVAIADVTAFGVYMGVWFPEVPHWIWVLSIVLIIGSINLMSVHVFGELEFWFSFFKVATIILMILVGVGVIVGGIGNGGKPTGIQNLWVNGGFFSHGIWGMILSLQVVMFAYGGIEIIGINAGEAKDPKKSIPKAINSVPLRILIFYVGTLFVIMSIFPWNQISTIGSPFVLTFQHIGITVAASILNFVVITASVSAINSDVFGVGRMLNGMAEQGHSPKILNKISKRGAPWVSVLFMMMAMLIAVYLNYIMPDKVFLVIASLATFATVFVWIMILLSQISFRCSLTKEEKKKLEFPLLGGVITSAIGIVFLIFIMILIGCFPSTRISLFMGCVWLILLILSYFLKNFIRKI